MKTTEQKLLSNEEIASFCNQAAMLFQAGIPPVEGMAILQSDAQSPEGKAIFDQILTVCRQGESFHKALEATGVFPDFCLNMIALGEESGNLDVCMNSLAEYNENEDAIANSIRDAVTYPFIMIAMMAAVIVVLVSRVMPIFEQGWGETYIVADNNIMVCISKLRAKLDEDPSAYIRTIRGLGYWFEK